eukprot:scaffold78709_cov60-Phaeocystis_antarctica.AAC.1
MENGHSEHCAAACQRAQGHGPGTAGSGNGRSEGITIYWGQQVLKLQSTERDLEQRTDDRGLEWNGPKTTSWRKATAPQVGPERSPLASLRPGAGRKNLFCYNWWSPPGPASTSALGPASESEAGPRP